MGWDGMVWYVSEKTLKGNFREDGIGTLGVRIRGLGNRNYIWHGACNAVIFLSILT
jgi:hypothetical protein